MIKGIHHASGAYWIENHYSTGDRRRQMHSPRVTIVILNWNGKNDTIECLNSLNSITYNNHDIFVVDNGSTDGSVECLKALFPGIEIIETGSNLGYAGGNNVGIQQAIDSGADYVLLLNNDIVVDKAFLDELVNVAESDEKIGFVGPKVYFYDYDGRRDVINFAGAKINYYRGAILRKGWRESDHGQYDQVEEMGFVEGSCVLVKRQVIEKVGVLDPEYFTYWEDIDWCARGYKAGYMSYYVPKSKIWHKISTSNVGMRKIYYMSRNRILFLKKNASRSQIVAFLIYLFVFSFWFDLCRYTFVHKDINKSSAYLRGVNDGIMTLLPSVLGLPRNNVPYQRTHIRSPPLMR